MVLAKVAEQLIAEAGADCSTDRAGITEPRGGSSSKLSIALVFDSSNINEGGSNDLLQKRFHYR
jgi:hypothetical protein